MSKLKHYWKELKRRHVVKAGIAYLVTAWLIIQVLSILFPAFEASPKALRTTITILGLCFPIWLIIAWIYDFSPEGIKKTDNVAYDAKVHNKKNIGLNRFIIGSLSIAVILLVFNTFRMQTKIDSIDAIYNDALATNFSSSIAVLVFDNLSPDKSEDFFAKGLSREIQQRLTKLKEIKVVSTNSSFKFEGQGISLEVIGQELDVAYLLGGSVVKTDNTYRANIELIDTQDGKIIWSKQFDGDIENILETFDSITKEVASYLKVTFDKSDVRQRKVDPEAYILLMKSLDTIMYHTKESTLAADSLIRESIALDPTYAPSQATLSATTLWRLRWREYSREEALKKGKTAAIKAIAYDPKYFDGYAWLSNWNWHERDAEASMRHLDSALKYAPNNAQMMNYAAHQAMRTNRVAQSLQFSNKGIQLDPKSIDNWNYKLFSEIMLQNFEEALKTNSIFMELDKKGGNIAIDAYIYSLIGNHDKALEVIEGEEDKFTYLQYKELILFNAGYVKQADSLIRKINLYPNDSIYQGIDNKNFTLATAFANRNDYDLSFEYLDKAYDITGLHLEWFFGVPEFKKLYDDPRWKAYIDRLKEEFNYEFPYRSG